MLKAIPRIFILTTLSLMGSIALQAQNVLDNKTYRVTALQRGNNSITSMSNYAEVSGLGKNSKTGSVTLVR